MTQLNLTQKLEILADAAKYDASCASSGTVKRSSLGTGGIGSTEGSGICHSYAPDGRCISLLKILLTNFCIYDCIYCVNRSSSNVKRARFSVEEVVALTLQFYRRNYIEGLFLSSGIIRSPDHTLEEMVRVARSLRTEHKFAGYIHLKVIPNAAPELLAEAGRYADRLSTNIELPTDASLATFAPQKQPSEIRTAMAHIFKIREASRPEGKLGGKRKPTALAPAGQSTQVIVGADGASDAVILDRSAGLYAGYGLKRVYYSAFSPIPDASSRLPLKPPPLLREHRLYQADWLLRFYGFSADEVVSGGTDGLLDLEIDPKLAWALKNRHRFPVDVNRADRELLLRVPGLGVKVIDRLIATRRHHRLRLDDVARLAGSIAKARPFIEAADWTPGGLIDDVRLRARLVPAPRQLELFSMQTIMLQSLNDFDEWRSVARALLLAAVPPEAVMWLEPGRGGDLFEVDAPPPAAPGRAVGTVPPRFIDWGEAGICHHDPERFGLLYRLLWRLQRDHGLLTARSDPDVGKLNRRVMAVRRDAHKMTAFVRFREVAAPDGTTRYIAWFAPAHFVLERTAPFFMRRFAGMCWAIITPYRSAAWDGKTLSFGPGGERADAPADDAMEEVWRRYYASIFDPARLKVAMMKSEMPMKYWRNLPEATLIPSLIRGARQAEAEMLERQATIPPTRHARQAERQPSAIPEAEEITSLAAAKAAAQGCRRCPLFEHATQTVFGEGPHRAEIMFVGEQPGDQDDLAGKPFVGPAGQVFDAALAVAGIDRSRVYVTNAVKHFKFEPRGKRRIHQKPNAGEIAACRFWLGLEREFVKPEVIVAMGATAVTSLLGKSASIASMRGRPTMLEDGTPLWVTVHPSYLLRMPDRALAAVERGRFEDDLRAIREFAAARGEQKDG